MVKVFPKKERCDIGSDLDIVQKSGAWYSYNGDRLGQGRENAKIFLKENEALFEEISAAIRDHYELDKDLEQPEEKSKEEQESLDL